MRKMIALAGAVALAVSLAPAAQGGHHEKKDIVDTAVAAGQFKTLATALQAAGLIDTLKGEGPFTVFAPTDEAFAKLPEGTVESLLKPENKDKLTAILTYHVVPGKVLSTDVKPGNVATLEGEGPFTVFAPTDEAFAKIPKADLQAILADKEKLTAILTYHVVAGKVTAADVVKLKSAKTVQGQSVKIDASDGVKVDGAKVVKADVMASNGVIHVIDSVILPN